MTGLMPALDTLACGAAWPRGLETNTRVAEVSLHSQSLLFHLNPSVEEGPLQGFMVISGQKARDTDLEYKA